MMSTHFKYTPAYLHYIQQFIYQSHSSYFYVSASNSWITDKHQKNSDIANELLQTTQLTTKI